MVKLRRLSEKLETRFFVGAFVLALCFSLYAYSVGFTHSLFDMHSFRQMQTALSALFMHRDWHWFAYQTPLFGPPWVIPFEYPLYQQVVAIFTHLSGLSVAQSGRLVSIFFVYATMGPLWLFLQSLGIVWRKRFIFLALYLLIPQHLFWGRTVLIESTALFLACAYVAFVLRWLQRRNSVDLGVACLLGMYGAAVKFTTFLAFGVLAAGLCVVFLLPDLRKNIRQGLIAGTTAIVWFAGIPFLALLAWTNYADAMKASNVFSQFIASENLTAWNFGTLKQRLSFDLWNMFFRNTIHDAIGHRTLFLVTLALALIIKRGWRIFLVCLGLFLIAPLTFTNLHIQHNYYAYANCLFLSFGVAWVIYQISKKEGWGQILALALLCTAMIFPMREWHRRYFQVQLQNQQDVFNLKRVVQAKTAPDDILLVWNAGWDAAIAFYTERRVIMDQKNLPLSSPPWQSILGRISQRDIGGLLFCGHYKFEEEFQRQQLAFLTPKFARGQVAFNCLFYAKVVSP